jgi:NhaA family Na+:H+ antiporter
MAGHSQTGFEKRAGLLLVAATLLAVTLANGPLAGAYHHLLEAPLGPAMPRLGILSLHQWIADGAMALFFLLVGLEVKREWIEGRLADPAQRRLPILAALAGMAVPATVYLLVVEADPELVRGWAIPAATDIAFAVGVLALLGRRAPPAIKLLLVTIAIIDDIGAVVVIAVAYSAQLDWLALGGALALTALMGAMARLGVRRLWPFMAGFVMLWLLVLASGVHPTIAGVLAALTVPIGGADHAASPLKRLEHALHPWVMFAIVPLFALASAGVAMSGGAAALASPLPLAVMLGLLVGKPLGILAAIWAMVAAGLAPMPRGIGWRHVTGAAALCGIGFTMSLFIGALAFPAQPALVEAAKLGTLAGSLVSALLGALILATAPVAAPVVEETAEAEDIFGANPTANR